MAVAKFLWEPHATGTARSLLPAVSPAPGERIVSRRFFDFHQQQARQFTSAACRARAAYASSEPRGGCSKRRRSFATLAFSLSLRAQSMNSGTEAALAQCANRFVHSSRSGTSQFHNLLLSKQKSTSTSNPATDSSPGDEGAPHFRKSSVPHPLYPSPPSPSPSPSSSRDQTIREKESANVTASMGKPAPDTHDSAQQQYTLPHPIWSLEEVESVRVHHTPPKGAVDKLAYYTMKSLRLCFDLFSGYSTGKLLGTLDERRWLTRIIFLETVAGVPGMVAAMTRHLRSLRYLQRDHGWIHTLLEEAENERMHLLTALELRRPGPLFKMAIVAAQGVFVTLFGAVYLISPRYCHRFVGYLEEEAVKTYTLCIESIDRGDLKMWAQMPAPPIAVKYWALKEGAMMRDVILAIRADEAHHRVVNHTLSSMAPSDPNPYHPGQRKT